MITWFVLPSPPTGNNRRIELAGIDLWLGASINLIFVYPSDLNIDQLKEALGRSLSLWPLIAGHLLLLENDRYFIEMSDQSIPVSFVDNTDLPQWPLDSTVVIDNSQTSLEPYLSQIQSEKLLDGKSQEPLFHMKLTRIVQSGEFIMGISWNHVLGDAESCLRFLNTISRLYQQLEPLKPDPVLERRLWHENEADQSYLPKMKVLRDAQPKEQIENSFMSYLKAYEQVNLHFSGEQLVRLHKLAGEASITIQDALSAYIIILLNTHCFDHDEQRITHAGNIINFRGVSDSIAPPGHVANSVFLMLSDDFDNLQSLPNIAMTIRRSINRSRERTFLEPYLATIDGLMRKIARENLQCRIKQYPNEIIINSNLKYDWADLVDFGHTDKCRFYTTGAGPFYLRVFRPNPIHDGTNWIERDRQGAEVAFLVENNIKSQLLDAWHKDINENFAQWENDTRY